MAQSSIYCKHGVNENGLFCEECEAMRINDNIEICIGPTTSGKIVVMMTGGNKKYINMDEARKLIDILRSSIGSV